MTSNKITAAGMSNVDLDINKLEKWVEEANSHEAPGRQEAVKRLLHAWKDNATKLDLSNLDLTSVPPGIECLQSLNELNLSGNQLATLSADVCKLKYLVSLDLSVNPIMSLPSGVDRLFATFTYRRRPCSINLSHTAMAEELGIPNGT